VTPSPFAGVFFSAPFAGVDRERPESVTPCQLKCWPGGLIKSKQEPMGWTVIARWANTYVCIKKYMFVILILNFYLLIKKD
jgi:hypothetical protein